MHYYKRNLGDYAKKCGRLTMMQHGAYTLLIDACYDREVFPTLRDSIEWTWASSKEEIEAVEFVLSRFFTLENGVYTQHRIVFELSEYHSKADQNKRIAMERETKRAAIRTNRAPVVNAPSPEQHEAPPNHKPLTTNQEPLVVPTSPKARRKHQLPIDFFPNEIGQSAAVSKGLSVAGEFMKFSDYHQSKGNAMADWQAAWRTWVGNARPPAATAQPETFKERDARLGREKWERMTGEQHPDNNPTAPTRSILDVVDVEIKILELSK